MIVTNPYGTSYMLGSLSLSHSHYLSTQNHYISKKSHVPYELGAIIIIIDEETEAEVNLYVQGYPSVT